MLSAFFVVVGGLFVFLVAIALIVTIILNTRRGLGAVQVERSRRWKLQQRTVVSEEWDARLTLWVPLHEGGGAVVRVDPAVRLFDLGPGTNWRVLMGEKWREWFVPWVPSRPSDFAFNAEVLSGLQQEARDRSV